MTDVPRVVSARTNVRAGISFHGPTLRYTELEHSGNKLRLRRLGSCNFDFDATEALSSGQPTDAIETVAEAVGDIFDGSEAEEIGIALHPRTCYSFYTPIHADASDDELREQILKELAFVADNETPLFVASEEVSDHRTGGDPSLTWLHILALPEVIRARLHQISGPLGIDTRLMPSALSAAGLLSRADFLWGVSTRSGAFMLSVGCFASHTEFAVRGPGLRYRTHFSEDVIPADAVYEGVALVERLRIPPSAVDVVLSYGDEDNQRSAVDLAHVFSADVRRLDPFDLVAVDGQRQVDVDSTEYVSCIGAAIDPWS